MSKGVIWGRKADTPVSIPDPYDDDDFEFVQQSDVSRQINDRGEPPPNLQTPFKKKVGAVYPQPSDFVNMQTYFLVGGQAPVSILNPQDAGMACRVTLINLGDGAGSGKVVIASSGDYIKASTSGAGQPQGFSLPPPAPATGYPAMPLTLAIAGGLVAICVNAVTAELSVLVESYSPDAYTWEEWEAGQQ